MFKPRASVRHVPAPVLDGLGLEDIGKHIHVTSVDDFEYLGILEVIKYDSHNEDESYIQLRGNNIWFPLSLIKEVYIEV